jgi:hypothetical protein
MTTTESREAALLQRVMTSPVFVDLPNVRAHVEQLITRHDATNDCDGTATRKVRVCAECATSLCACEAAYGHDCEDAS